MNKPYTISKQQRSDFIAQMDRKWQQKYKREEFLLTGTDDRPTQSILQRGEQYLW